MVLPRAKSASPQRGGVGSQAMKSTATESRLASASRPEPGSHGADGREEGDCASWELFSLEVTRKEYEEKCKTLFDRGLAPVSRLLDRLDLTVGEIDEVVVVGGMTRTPRVREMLKTLLGISRLNVEIDPDVVVAYGAATMAH